MRAHLPNGDPHRMPYTTRTTGGAEPRPYEIRVRGPTARRLIPSEVLPHEMEGLDMNTFTHSQSRFAAALAGQIGRP
jgi:hypothetical protein